MTLLEKKLYDITDLGKVISLRYTLQKQKGCYMITIRSRLNGEETSSSSGALSLHLLAAVQFYRMLIKDRATPEILQEIVENQC